VTRPDQANLESALVTRHFSLIACLLSAEVRTDVRHGGAGRTASTLRAVRDGRLTLRNPRRSRGYAEVAGMPEKIRCPT
jgi:hypothetical protein